MKETNPLQIEKRSLGIIISNDKLIVGYISRNGSLCKLIDPINLKDLSKEAFNKVIRSLPLVKGFTSENKENLINLLDSEGMLVSKETLLKDSQNKLDILETELQNQRKLTEHLNTCKDKILYEKDIIIQHIKDFRYQVEQHIKSQIMRNENLQDTIKSLTDEKQKIETTLKQVQEHEQLLLEQIQDDQDLHTDFSYQMNSKNETIDELNKTIKEIKNELAGVTGKLTESELKNQQLSICIDQILREKDTIISKIKEYNQNWLEWAKNNDYNISEYKKKIQNDMSIIYRQLENVLNNKNEYVKNLNIERRAKDQIIRDLKQNVADIKNELTKTVNQQLLEMSIKKESETREESNLIQQKNLEIEGLKSQLDEIKILLEKSQAASKDIRSQESLNTDQLSVCYDTLKKFISINNSFYKKQEIITRLDKIIFDHETFSNFTNLSDPIKKDIQERYIKIRDQINQHIRFLDLEKYISNPNVELFKSQSTVQKVDPQFCKDLELINQYWQDNIQTYNQHDFDLMNIYEDLSGSIRIYVKVKPLLGIEQKNDTVIINKKNDSITIDCSNVPSFDRDIKKEVFSNFYGIFDETFDNAEVFTGTPGSIADTDFKFIDREEGPHSLKNTFAQVQDGYSVVLFGYGTSGSGKTRVLLGEPGIPGLIHYSLANLKGVENIRIKNIFEQGIDRFTPTLKLITSKIHNLVNRLPTELNRFSVNETDEFNQYHNLNLNNITTDNLDSLTNSITRYRSEHNRIRKTPNNPVSSRTHLYIVFEIKFITGKTGYITFIDMAGKESPLDIFNTFMDQSGRFKPNLTSILGPTGGASRIVIKQELRKDYSQETVYEILKEGIYIDETIGHLNYFFHKKNYKKYKITYQSDLDHYSTSKFYVDPREEETRISTNNNVLMIPILKYIDSLSKTSEFKPTKFITMICIRKDQEYCGQIFDSLKVFN